MAELFVLGTYQHLRHLNFDQRLVAVRTIPRNVGGVIPMFAHSVVTNELKSHSE